MVFKDKFYQKFNVNFNLTQTQEFKNFNPFYEASVISIMKLNKASMRKINDKLILLINIDS